MPEDEQEPTQPTQPKGKPGQPPPEPIQIPVPKREDVLRNLRKVAKPKPRNGKSADR